MHFFVNICRLLQVLTYCRLVDGFLKLTVESVDIAIIMMDRISTLLNSTLIPQAIKKIFLAPI